MMLLTSCLNVDLHPNMYANGLVHQQCGSPEPTPTGGVSLGSLQLEQGYHGTGYVLVVGTAAVQLGVSWDMLLTASVASEL